MCARAYTKPAPPRSGIGQRRSQHSSCRSLKVEICLPRIFCSTTRLNCRRCRTGRRHTRCRTCLFSGFGTCLQGNSYKIPCYLPLGNGRQSNCHKTRRSEIDPGCKHHKSPHSRHRIACVRLFRTPCSSCTVSALPCPGTYHSHTEGTHGYAQRYPSCT